MKKGDVFCKETKSDEAKDVYAKLEDLLHGMHRLSSALAVVARAGAECSSDPQIVCVDMSCALDLLIEEVERQQERIEKICVDVGRIL